MSYRRIREILARHRSSGFDTLREDRTEKLIRELKSVARLLNEQVVLPVDYPESFYSGYRRSMIHERPGILPHHEPVPYNFLSAFKAISDTARALIEKLREAMDEFPEKEKEVATEMMRSIRKIAHEAEEIADELKKKEKVKEEEEPEKETLAERIRKRLRRRRMGMREEEEPEKKKEIKIKEEEEVEKEDEFPTSVKAKAKVTAKKMAEDLLEAAQWLNRRIR
jgi:phosphomevalonate kinase